MRLRLAPLTLAGLLGLGLLNAWLAGLLLGDDARDLQGVVAPDPPLHPPAFDAKPPKPKPFAAYGQTLARPVFFKSRQPYVAPPPTPPPPPKPVAAPPPAPVDPGLVLGGVAIMGGARKAYIFSKTDPRGTWLSEGETIPGWTVKSIDAGSANLQQAGRSIELQLYPKR